MSPPVRILMLEDSEDDELLVRREVERAGVRIAKLLRVETLQELEAAVHREPWDVAILDFNLPQAHALGALATLERIGCDLPALVVTGSIDEEVAAGAFRAGAKDVVVKSRLARLVPALRRELSDSRMRKDNRRVAEQLQASEERFRSFMQQLPLLVWLEDAEGRFAYVNDSYAQFFGRETWQILGRTVSEIHTDEHRETLAELAARVRTTHRAAQQEIAARDARGETHQLLTLLFRLGEGQSIGGVAFDTTSQRRAEAAARASDERFRAVAEAASDGIVTLDEHGCIVYCNPAGERILGRAEPTIVGHPLREMLDAESGARVAAELPRMLAERAPSVASELVLVRPDGTRVPVEMTVGAWREGERRLLTAILRDVTHRHQLEEQLAQAQKIEAIGQLAGGIAHDFNNILGVVSSYAELIGHTMSADDVRLEDIAEVHHAVDRGATLVRQLLAFSRKQVLSPTAVDPNAMIRELEKMLRRAIGEHIEWRTELAPDVHHVFADRGQLEQIVLNLVVNARDAMPRGGRLTVRTHNDVLVAENGAAAPCAVLSVSDTGIGMDAATRARIFEPFFTTKGPGRGTGLGLATVYGIVRQSNGTIHVESELGRGSTFELRLPRAEQAATPEQRLSTPTTPLPARGEVVLVVEDSPELRGATVRVLRKAGYSVIDCARAEDALALVRTGGARPEVVVSDVLLPGMSGAELVEVLRAERPEIGVLLVSGYTGGELETARPPDGVPFLEKPVSAALLLKQVGRMLGQPGGEP